MQRTTSVSDPRMRSRRHLPGLVILLGLVLAGCASDAELDTLKPAERAPLAEIDDLRRSGASSSPASCSWLVCGAVALARSWRNRVPLLRRRRRVPRADRPQQRARDSPGPSVPADRHGRRRRHHPHRRTSTINSDDEAAADAGPGRRRDQRDLGPDHRRRRSASGGGSTATTSVPDVISRQPRCSTTRSNLPTGRHRHLRPDRPSRPASGGRTARHLARRHPLPLDPGASTASATQRPGRFCTRGRSKRTTPASTSASAPSSAASPTARMRMQTIAMTPGRLPGLDRHADVAGHVRR